MTNDSSNSSSAHDLDATPELLALFEALTDVMFCLKDTAGTYIAVNGAFVRRTGRRSRRDVLGKTATDLFQPLLADRYVAQDRAILGSGQPLRDALELIRIPDGSLGWYVTTKLPVKRSGKIVGIASVSRDLNLPGDTAVAMESLTGVVEYVKTHLSDSLRVADIAKAVGCSVGQLDRRMRKVFRLTATQYVLKARVQRAASLLSGSTLSLAEVAMESGFYDQAHLTSLFGRLVGETPAQFRARE